jgi:hypothetical protein
MISHEWEKGREYTTLSKHFKIIPQYCTVSLVWCFTFFFYES